MEKTYSRISTEKHWRLVLRFLFHVTCQVRILYRIKRMNCSASITLLYAAKVSRNLLGNQRTRLTFKIGSNTHRVAYHTKFPVKGL